jgi:hypothetical protein
MQSNPTAAHQTRMGGMIRPAEEAGGHTFLMTIGRSLLRRSPSTRTRGMNCDTLRCKSRLLRQTSILPNLRNESIVPDRLRVSQIVTTVRPFRTPHPDQSTSIHRIGMIAHDRHACGAIPRENQRASVSALNIPDALCRVSWYSSAATESATTPPPAGNCSQPPFTVKVRMRMLLSSSPWAPR